MTYDSGAGPLPSGGSVDVINGKKPLPMNLMAGYANMLSVDKCVLKLGHRKPKEVVPVSVEIEWPG